MLATADQIQHVGLSEKGAELAEYLKLLADQGDRSKRPATRIDGVGLVDHLATKVALRIDQCQEADRQRMERHTREGRRHRFGKYHLRPVAKKEPNGQVHQYSQTEVRRFAMLQGMKSQKIPPVTKNIPKRLILFDAMLNFDDKVKPFLKSIGEGTYHHRQMNTTGIALYLQKKVAPALNQSPASFTQPNISSLMTQIVRVFEFAGLIKKTLADTKGKSFDYTWTIDLKMHQITKEQLEWAFNKVWNDPEFKKTLQQAKTLKKPVTAVDNMDKSAKKVLESVLDENTTLKEENERLQIELAALRNGGSSSIEHGSGVTHETQIDVAADDDFGNLEQSPTPALRSEPPPTIKTIPARETAAPTTQAPDPFQALDKLRGHLTRGSQIKIEITL